MFAKIKSRPAFDVQRLREPVRRPVILAVSAAAPNMRDHRATANCHSPREQPLQLSSYGVDIYLWPFTGRCCNVLPVVHRNQPTGLPGLSLGVAKSRRCSQLAPVQGPMQVQLPLLLLQTPFNEQSRSVVHHPVTIDANGGSKKVVRFQLYIGSVVSGALPPHTLILQCFGTI
jgi:hypothetical protein